MTCVVGIALPDGTLVVGADSMVKFVGMPLRSGQKFGVWEVRDLDKPVGEIFIGLTGWGRVMHWMLAEWSPPLYSGHRAQDGWDTYPFEAVSSILKQWPSQPYSKGQEDEEGNFDTAFLVGWNGRLSIISGNLAQMETPPGRQCMGIGCGGSEAVAALMMAERLGGKVSDIEVAINRLRAAIGITCEINEGVGGDVVIDVIKGRG